VRKTFLLSLFLLSSSFALTLGQTPPCVIIDGKYGGKVDGTAWDSKMLKGKVYVLFYVDPDKKDLNEPFSEALKARNFPHDKYTSVAIVNMAATWMPNFAIDANSGTITTLNPFDREKKDKYSIVVVATDKGTDPRQLSEEVTVRILIVDQNDQQPKFNQSSFSTSVAENAPIGTRILELRATDQDIGDNALLYYFISGGDTSGFFSVETVVSRGKTYGILVVNGFLDYETKKSYTVKVSASDGRSSDETSVSINVSFLFVLPLLSSSLSSPPRLP